MSTSTQTQITPFFSPPTILLPSLVITPPRVAFGVSAVHTLWIVLTDIFSLFLNFTPRSWSSARVCDCEASRVLVDKSLNQSDPRHARSINGVNVVTFTHFINVGLFLGLLPYSKVLVIKPNDFRPKRSNKYGHVCGNGWVVRRRVVIIVVNRQQTASVIVAKQFEQFPGMFCNNSRQLRGGGWGGPRSFFRTVMLIFKIGRYIGRYREELINPASEPDWESPFNPRPRRGRRPGINLRWLVIRSSSSGRRNPDPVAFGMPSLPFGLD
ncbi:hypothetical protein B0H16DRAFT_1701027 [Mycena metata]|uniref:Uncharacterized protein n=1 Tax=Mycena metata TaxID=1033252 RepID=A0AAD7HDG1_9AGAR|nr:hypothetical protein B0H16DRAFT_1701027 [Mycena metata]